MKIARHLMRRAWATATLLMLTAACLPAAADCDATRLGVSRVLHLELAGAPVPDQLAPGEVVLSFDDGPARNGRVLEALEAECTRATFFLIGQDIPGLPGQAQHLINMGHTVGSHTHDHANLTKLPLADAVTDAVRGREDVEAVLKQPVALFRFPFAISTPELEAAVSAEGMIPVGVSADGKDWTGIPPEDSVAMILAKLEEHGRKGVILLHDPLPKAAERTRLLLQALKEQGYRVVALEGPAG
ncbi:MAG: polysaccharide deacetylase family protein [Hyphomonas sp.]|nr:polysaccharide deacetylase family protein [Hyphomonas sp.]